jgi:hypothetical protein
MERMENPPSSQSFGLINSMVFMNDYKLNVCGKKMIRNLELEDI